MYNSTLPITDVGELKRELRALIWRMRHPSRDAESSADVELERIVDRILLDYRDDMGR